MMEMTLVKIKDTINHKGQILGQTSDFIYFQHQVFWKVMVAEVENDSKW